MAVKADNVSSVSASACHIGGPIYVNPGELALVYGNKIDGTRIMVSKGMVSKSKYWNLEKNKGTPVSICLHVKGIFLSQYSLFLNFKGFLLIEINHSGEKPHL